jgi:hypothetical protein
MNDETLRAIGKLVEGTPPRDAVHLAVVAVEAGEELPRAQPVTLVDGKAFAYERGAPVGIVDPWLMKGAKTGQRFWLFLNPGSITSLRHDWTHPAFPAPVLIEPKEESASERYLRKLADDHDLAYNVLVSTADAGSTYTAQGYDLHLSLDDEDWKHVEAVTGRTYDETHREKVYFSCSC